jgi:hypothetical protein
MARREGNSHEEQSRKQITMNSLPNSVTLKQPLKTHFYVLHAPDAFVFDFVAFSFAALFGLCLVISW